MHAHASWPASRPIAQGMLSAVRREALHRWKLVNVASVLLPAGNQYIPGCKGSMFLSARQALICTSS